MNTVATYRCPNCGAGLPGDATSCLKCNSSFGGQHAWKPLLDVPPPPSAPPEDSTLKVLRILGYVSLVFSPAFLTVAGMAFDAPGAEKHVLPYVVVLIAVAYVALPFVVPAAARAVLSTGQRKLAIAIASFPVSIIPSLMILNYCMYLITAATNR